MPLLRLGKYVWANAEIFVAETQVAHYGPADLRNAVLEWKLTASSVDPVHRGEVPAASIVQGSAPVVSTLSFPLRDLRVPARYDLELLIRGAPFRNRWPIWIYHAMADADTPADVRVAPRLDAVAQQNSVEGDTMLLLPPLDVLVSNNPSESHTNWQWWHLIKNSRAVVVDGTSPGYRPIVQVIDNVSRNHKLGIIFEFRVGKGRLLVCTADLQSLKDRPEAAQLQYSLLAYAVSPQFQPTTTIDLTMSRKLLGIHVVSA